MQVRFFLLLALFIGLAAVPIVDAHAQFFSTDAFVASTRSFASARAAAGSDFDQFENVDHHSFGSFSGDALFASDPNAASAVTIFTTGTVSARTINALSTLGVTLSSFDATAAARDNNGNRGPICGTTSSSVVEVDPGMQLTWPETIVVFGSFSITTTGLDVSASISSDPVGLRASSSGIVGTVTDVLAGTVTEVDIPGMDAGTTGAWSVQLRANENIPAAVSSGISKDSLFVRDGDSLAISNLASAGMTVTGFLIVDETTLPPLSTVRDEVGSGSGNDSEYPDHYPDEDTSGDDYPEDDYPQGDYYE